MGNNQSFGSKISKTSIHHSEETKVRDGYYRNNKKIYYKGVDLNLLKESRRSFKKLKYGYAKTNEAVYYKGNIIPGADHKTFITLNRKNVPEEFKHFNSVVGMDYANGKRNIYQFGNLVYTLN